MKKLHFLLLIATIVSFASCSSNDDPATNYADRVAGTYEGYTVAGCQYFGNQVAAEQTLTIKGTSEINKVTVGYVSSTWGTITIEDATVAESGSGYTIAGSGKSVMGMAGSSQKEYECQMSGVVENGEATVTFKCPAVMGGLTIEFKPGEVPAEIVVPGTYTGYTEAKSAYFQSMLADDQTIEITANGDGSYSVAYTSDSWGEFSVKTVKATYEAGVFTLSGEGTTKMGMNGNLKDYACKLSGSIDAAKDDPTFTFTMPTVMGGLTVTFHTGDMPEGN